MMAMIQCTQCNVSPVRAEHKGARVRKCPECGEIKTRAI